MWEVTQMVLKGMKHGFAQFCKNCFQWETSLSSKKADLAVTDLLVFMSIMVIPVQIKTDHYPAYAPRK